MAGIITITFSPCIDKSTSVHALIPEKKLKCSAPKLEPGGGGINVARAVKKLGGIATAIYPAGGYTGKFFDKLLADEAIPSIIIASENETRENIIVWEESTRRQYRFGMPGTELKEKEWKQILGAIEEIKDVDFIVASGSLPPGVPDDVFAQIGEIAKRRNIKFIADTSGNALKLAAGGKIFLLKPNLGELASLTGKTYLEPANAVHAAKEIIQKGNCSVIVVSMGESGAMLVTKDIVKKYSPPQAERKSTVGAGDSMVAGIVFALSKKESLEYAVRYGVACGTAATLNAGTELCHKEDADRLFAQVKESEAIW